MKLFAFSAMLLGMVSISLSTSAQTTAPQRLQPPSANSITAKGCIVHESDGYYLTLSQNDRLFLNWDPAAAQSVNHMAIVEGTQEGQANNTYAGASGQNTVKFLHVTRIQKLPQSCGSASTSPLQNPNSTYSPNTPPA